LLDIEAKAEAAGRRTSEPVSLDKLRKIKSAASEARDYISDLEDALNK
jgi:hypothetical protein